MEQGNTTTETSEPRAPATELIRPSTGRMLAGVAQGLANRFGFPVVLIRVLFCLLVFAGGLGLALYAAGWFLIRAEEEAEPPAKRVFSGATTTRSWIGIGLVFLAVLILLDNFTFLSGGIVWAIGLLVVGVLLYTGDLPRLVKPPADDKEGVQRMTSTTETVAPVTETPSGGGPTGGGAPPTPVSRPPTPPPAPPRPRETSYLGRITLGVMLIGAGVLAILDNIASLPIHAEPRHYMALTVTILGLGLMVGGFMGRARWLILVGVILVPTMLFSPAFEYDWSADTFDRIYSPDSFGELRDSYVQDVGNLRIDLTHLPWSGQEVVLDVEVDAGNIDLVIPPGVGIVGEATVDVGQVSAPPREVVGLGTPTLTFDEPGDRGTIDLDARVDVGSINIYSENGFFRP
jgi:phage shock protein PspC (stress-responsive transcriptional regulator)